MTDNNKPEWFEIADNDGPIAPLKASKTLPIAAVMVAALILGVGAVVAQSPENLPANATEITAVQAATTNSSAPAVKNSQSNAAVVVDRTPKAVNVAQVSLQNPAIAKLPTKGAGDDEGDDEGYDEGDDD
jgi:hypothetical protein